MPTDIGAQFDLHCRKHPERLIDDRARPERMCAECYIAAWNAGARYADKHWADDPPSRYSDEDLRMHAIGRSRFGKELKDD